jgi:hypothetical protein
MAAFQQHVGRHEQGTFAIGAKNGAIIPWPDKDLRRRRRPRSDPADIGKFSHKIESCSFADWLICGVGALFAVECRHRMRLFPKISASLLCGGVHRGESVVKFTTDLSTRKKEKGKKRRSALV